MHEHEIAQRVAVRSLPTSPLRALRANKSADIRSALQAIRDDMQERLYDVSGDLKDILRKAKDAVDQALWSYPSSSTEPKIDKAVELLSNLALVDRTTWIEQLASIQRKI
mgnify:CR=1 FL=1